MHMRSSKTSEWDTGPRSEASWPRVHRRALARLEPLREGEVEEEVRGRCCPSLLLLSPPMNARESCSKHIHLGLWPLVAFRECFWVLLSDFWEGVFTLFSIAYYFSLKTNPLTLMSAEPLVQKAVDVNCSGSVMDGDTEGSCSSKPTDGETDKVWHI